MNEKKEEIHLQDIQKEEGGENVIEGDVIVETSGIAEIVAPQENPRNSSEEIALPPDVVQMSEEVGVE
jgi:hypothetical protein